eukprot:15473658-Alexandrium_andersonii.AAC.4
MEASRSEMLVKPRSNIADSADEDVVAGGHVLEGFYEAALEDPQNTNILATIAAGVRVARLDHRTPADVVTYFKDQGNLLNRLGSATSHLEWYDCVDEISAAWARHRKVDAAPATTDVDADPIGDFDEAEGGQGGENSEEDGDGDGARAPRCQAGYEKEFKAWITKYYPNKFGKFHTFKSARSFEKKMEAAGLMEAYESYVNEHGIFADTSVNNDTIL